MQPLVILLIAVVVVAADAGFIATDLGLPVGGWTAAVAAFGPIVVALAAMQLVSAWCIRRIDTTATAAPVVTAERAVRVLRGLMLLGYATAVLGFGWLGAVRSVVGDGILIDELVTMLPALFGLTAAWWVYYPVERRLRDALLVRRLDDGQPVYPTPSRAQYVLLQLQIQVLLLLVPILVILAVSEAIESAAGAWGDGGGWRTDVATFAAALAVFALAPLLVGLVLSVRPLTPGPLREELAEVCRRHAVKVRRILLWNTRGTMINAAVMGLVGPLRSILMTDALVETLPRTQVLAVMAHEIGHVRRRHMPWLVVTLMATLAVSVAVVTAPLAVLDRAGVSFDAAATHWIDLAATGLELALALLLFGWICRRFERQADTFAVQHLSGLGLEASGPDGPSGLVRLDAVATMCGALDSVARLNAVDPRRRSWRHGSISWRQAYMETLVGRPLAGLRIDRTIQRLKIASALTLVLAGAAAVWVESGAASAREVEAAGSPFSAITPTESTP